MKLHSHAATASLERIASIGLLAQAELATVRQVMGDPKLGIVLQLAETLHLHIKVDDTERLPRESMEAAGARLDHGREGFVKFRFPGGLNVILSHIAISADDLRESPANRRARPFLDHIGIDVREESSASKLAFDALPCMASGRHWLHVAQGGAGRGVKCCHVEVSEKHWLFPDAPVGARAIPIEVAYGPLREIAGAPGCDLRPAHPGSASAGAAACCATGPQLISPAA
jgi:hypothetical protein